PHHPQGHSTTSNQRCVPRPRDKRDYSSTRSTCQIHRATTPTRATSTNHRDTPAASFAAETRPFPDQRSLHATCCHHHVRVFVASCGNAGGPTRVTLDPLFPTQHRR